MAKKDCRQVAGHWYAYRCMPLFEQYAKLAAKQTEQAYTIMSVTGATKKDINALIHDGWTLESLRFYVMREGALSHSPASTSRPTGQRGDERTEDGR